MANKTTIKLDYPVQLADKTLTEVTMRRPLIRDMLKHRIDGDMTIQDTVALMCDLCEVTSDEMELLDTIDFEKLVSQLLSFRGVAQKKGSNAASLVIGQGRWN